jgi:hypothetical protein
LQEQGKAVEFRQRGNALSKLLGAKDGDAQAKEEARKEAEGLKESLAAIAELEKDAQGGDGEVGYGVAEFELAADACWA